MDQQEGQDHSPLPIDFNGSLDPSQLPNVTLGNHSMMASHREPYSPVGSKYNGAGRRSPVKTIKEYDQQVSDLTKENFNLKLRIYHLEERMEQQYGDEQNVFKTNIELKVQVDHLKEELEEKQIYLQKAAQAVSTMTVNHQQAEESIRKQCTSDRQKDVDILKEKLDKAVQDCEIGKKQAEEATKELEKMGDGLRLAHKSNEELSQKLDSAQSEIASLESKLKDSDGQVDELQDVLSSLQKQLERKDRDMKRLSVCFQDESHVESTSILGPQHLQDKYEDQMEELQKLKMKISDLEGDLMLKDKKLEEVEKELQVKLKELDDKAVTIAKCQKTIGGMMSKICAINKKNEDKDKKLKAFESKVNELNCSLDAATKEKNQIVNDSMVVQETNDHLLHQMGEVRQMAEGMAQSLGKKQGEMTVFQEQLSKAMEALTSSERAVEELQMQLKKERAEFENKLRNQAQLFEQTANKSSDANEEMASLRQQLMELKRSMADQNVVISRHQRNITDLERENKRLRERERDLLAERESQDRKILLLEREIQTLRLELERRDMRIGNLQQNTVHIEGPCQKGNRLDVNVQVLPMNVTEELRLLLDNFHHELLVVKVLQDTLQNLKSSHNGVTSDTPSDFEAVQKIYQKLEEGLVKNNQLHHHLLSFLQANGPNKASKDAPATSTQSPLSRDVHALSHDIMGMPVTHYTPSSRKNGQGVDGTDFTDNKLHLSDLKHPGQGSKISPPPVRLFHSANPSQTANTSTNLCTPGHPANASSHMETDVLLDESLTHVSLLDHSLTDDAKEGSLRHSDSRDYISLDHYFEPRMQDRESLYRVDSEDEFYRHYTLSPQGHEQGTTTNPTSANLIDLFTEPQPHPQSHQNRKENNSFKDRSRQSVTETKDKSYLSTSGRKSREMNESHSNITMRSVDLADSFASITARLSSGLKPNNGKANENLNASAGNNRATKESDKNGSPLAMKANTDGTLLIRDAERASLSDPDIVKSTNMSGRKDDSLEDDALNGSLVERMVSDENGERRNSWADELAPYKMTSDGHTQTTPNRGKPLQDNNEVRGDTLAVDEVSLLAQLQETVRQKEEALSEVQELNEKLEATENTVRQLSRKLKNFQSTVEQTGSNPSLKRRSSSEASLTRVGSQPRKWSLLRTGSEDRDEGGAGDGIATMFVDRASIEKGRDEGVSHPSVKNFSTLSSDLIMPSPNCTKRSWPSKIMESESTCLSSPEKPEMESNRTLVNSVLDNTTMTNWNEKSEEKEEDDPTLTSMLVTDYTFLHKRLSILSQSVLPNPGEQSFNNATLDVDKLQARLAHLERIIMMQKEEITVYESLLASMGYSVPLTADNGTEGSDGENTSESLLRQHLVEIRRLRQRLENLDLGNDPDQLLIFHTHTQQRITHQEHTISHLQQRLVEKEDRWHRETMETEHRLNREKAQLAQRLEIAQEELQNQHTTLEEQEKVLKKLKESLLLGDEERQEMEKENEKLKQEKAEIEEDLGKREREFLDMETTMFKLEMAKEEVESQKSMVKAELEEQEKQVLKMKSDVDHYKESCRSLREVVRSKEDSLQEQTQCLKKMALEKSGADEKLSQLHGELEEMKSEADRMRLETEEKKSLEVELAQVKNLCDQKTRSHLQILDEKAELELAMSRLNEEKLNLRVDSEKRIADLRQEMENSKIEMTRMEFELKKRQGLGEEVSNLRSMLDKRRNLESELRSRVSELEADLRKEEAERAKMEDDLRERTEKVQKRDRQCQFLCDRFGKLDAAYTKQNTLLKNKTEALNSMKKQVQLYEQTLSSMSKDNNQGTMKELFHELMLTKKQVADLLTRLETSSKQLPHFSEVLMDSFESASSSVATTKTETTTMKSTSLNSTTTTISENITSTMTGGLDNLDGAAGSSIPSPMKNYDVHSLFAVYKLDQHEKARKETGECLVSLSGVEARLEDRLKAYKAKSVTESIDYSTLREAGIACQQMRTCLNEVFRIVSHAWITELPPVNEQGRFYDPDMTQEKEKLMSELGELQSKYNALDQTVQDQQGKLQVSKQRQKDWEHSVCRQLVRTSQDLEQAKENLDLSRGILQQVNTSAKANSEKENVDVSFKTGGGSTTPRKRLSVQFENE